MSQTIVAATLQYDTSGAQKSAEDFNNKLNNGTATVKSFRQQMKEATEDLAGAIQNYGQFSTQAQEAAKRLGDLKNIAGDAQKVAANFATDGSKGLNAFTNAARGLAGGFTALTGAMALFGTQSEDVQKTLLKVQGALALTEGLNSITDIQKGWQNFTTIVKQSSIVQGAYNWVMTGTVAVTEAETAATVQATAAAIAFRAALLFLTGGAIVAGIIAIVVALNSTSKAAEDAERKQKAYNDAVAEASGAYKDAYTNIAKLKQEFAAAASNTDLQKKALEDFNKSIGDSTKLQKTFNDAQAWLADDANTQAYVNAMLQRATATAAIGKAADASLKVQQGYQQIDQLAQTVTGKISQPIVQDAIAYLKKSGDITGAANELQKAIDKLSTKGNNEAGDYNAFPIVRDMIGILNSIKEAKTSVEDFTQISKNQTDEYNKYMTEHGYHEGNAANAEAVKKTLDDLLKKQMDNLAAMQKAAEHDAEVSQANEAEKTNIQVIAQEARISLLKSHLDKARAIGGEYYANYLQQEKQAELDLLALRDNYNKQLETQADAANVAELSRASKFRDNLKLVWTTGPNAGQETTQPIGEPIRLGTQVSGLNQEDKSPAVQQYQKYQEAVKNLNNLSIEDNDQSKNGVAAFALNLKNRLDMLHDYYDKAIQAAREAGATQEEIERISAEARLNIQLSTASQIAAGAAQLFGQQTAAGKAFAIVQTTIDTYQSATSAYKAMAGIPVVGPALGAVAAAAAIAAGIANVKKIVSVQVPGQGGGGSAPSAANITPSAPLTPQLPQQANTTLNQAQLNQIGNATVRAFVIESDIASNAEKVARLNRAARLGG